MKKKSLLNRVSERIQKGIFDTAVVVAIAFAAAKLLISKND